MWSNRLKHQIVRSPLGRPLLLLRDQVSKARLISHPELGVLKSEATYVRSFLSQTIKPDWTCVDVGGHIGSFSAELQRLSPRGNLIIIEADQDKARLLSSGFPNARVHAVAVSDSDGQASFHVNLSKPGFSSLADRSDRGSTVQVTVEQRKLDTLLDGADVDFVKLDVEGFELEAVLGGMELLKRCRPIILFEAGSSKDSSIDSSKADTLFTLLTDELNYDVYSAMDLFFGRRSIDLQTFNLYRRYPFMAFNYIALPRSTTVPPSRREAAQ
jgi:FkbM family methyltransferase